MELLALNWSKCFRVRPAYEFWKSLVKPVVFAGSSVDCSSCLFIKLLIIPKLSFLFTSFPAPSPLPGVSSPASYLLFRYFSISVVVSSKAP